jgi:hypothetical protein
VLPVPAYSLRLTEVGHHSVRVNLLLSPLDVPAGYFLPFLPIREACLGGDIVGYIISKWI